MCVFYIYNINIYIYTANILYGIKYADDIENHGCDIDIA